MSPPWMPLYVADYLADTGHLSAAEHGAYLLLIMHYWRQGGLPADEKTLARIARMNDREWRASRDTIAALFSAGWVHARIDSELDKARDKSDRRAEAGARGGKAKASRHASKPEAIASDLLQQKPAVALASSSQPESDTTSNDVVARQAAPKPKAVRSKPRTEIAPNQQPTLDDAREAHAVGMRGNDMRDEWRKFRDHHIGKGSKMADWSAAWRTWCGNFRKFGQARGSPRQPAGTFMAQVASGAYFEDTPDDQSSREHQSSEGPGDAKPRLFGFDRDLPEPGRDDGGGSLLDLRAADAGWR